MTEGPSPPNRQVSFGPDGQHLGQSSALDRIAQMEAAADEARERMEEEVRKVEEEVRKLPFVSEIAELVDDGSAYVQRIGMRRADELTAAAASKMINSMGATMLNALHDHAMPKAIHSLVDDVYGNMWPEIKKTMMDAVMLSASLEFGSVRNKEIGKEDSPAPKPLLKRMAARLIYAMEPYDLGFWGTIRSPLSLCIQLLFYFPFYGISDLCVLTLAAAKAYTNFNEYGLIQFIVSSKRLQFITSGLMSTTYAFTKIFICATYRETRDTTALDFEPSYLECRTFAPGTHRTFIFEFCLFVLRSVLNWVVFYLLWHFTSVQAFRDTTVVLQAQQRLRVNTDRRAVPPRLLQLPLLLLTWGVAGLCAGSILFAAEEEVDGDWLGYSDVALVALALQLFTHRMLLYPCRRAWPAKAVALFSLCVGVYLYLRLPSAPGAPLQLAWQAATRLDQVALGEHLRAVLSAGTPVFPMALEMLLCAVCCGLHLVLLAMQNAATRRDEAAVRRLELVLSTLDQEGDGTISRGEARQKYHLFLLDSAAALARQRSGILNPGEAALFEVPNGTKTSNSVQDAKTRYGWGYTGKPTPADEAQIALAEEHVDGFKSFDEFWAGVDVARAGRVELKRLKLYYGVVAAKELRPSVDMGALKLDDPNYVQKRLEELHEWEFGRVKNRPGGALVYWVIWDMCAFSLAVLVIIPFVYREARAILAEDPQNDFGDVLEDWRVRCALYFLKVFIAMLSFPFLVYALPLAQDWLTHVKASGYDKAANCVQKYSSAQIKAKFRHLYNEEVKRRAKGSSQSDKIQDCWDSFIGVDVDHEMRVDPIESDVDPSRKNQPALSVVEAAELRRRQQARNDFGDEASLMIFEHKNGTLQLQGDPSSLMML
jgi:hypothetical protein